MVLYYHQMVDIVFIIMVLLQETHMEYVQTIIQFETFKRKH